MAAEKRALNDGWLFAPQYTKEMMQKDYQETGMEQVRIPHTCKEVPLHYFDESLYQMQCAYRIHFDLKKEEAGKRVFVTFDGVAHSCVLYCNGMEVNRHACGYTAFETELTPYVAFGEDNVLALMVDTRENQNIPPFGYVVDYMTFGGIYREVRLEVTNQVRIKDQFVRPAFEKHKPAGVEFDLTLDGPLEGLEAIWYIRSEKGDYLELARRRPAKEKITVKADLPKGEGLVWKPWSPSKPALYEIKTVICGQDGAMEELSQRIGFRNSRFTAGGFSINGKRCKIRGLNRHQSYPYVGYAMPDSMQRYDAEILKKELGVNAVRTSHYPQSQAFLDACDELGLMVFMEFPGWQYIGDEQWKQQALCNEEEMIVQYRNHPSIILWGVRINESPDDDSFYERTNALAHKLDPTRPTGGVRAIKNSHLLEDVYTYNDFVHEGDNKGVEPKKKVTSRMDMPYLVSEYNGHMFPTKSFDCEDRRVEHALRHAKVLEDVASYPDICGSFGWCMFDYNTHKDFGSGDRVCYHGVTDMFRNPKLAAAVYASQQEREAFLEVGSSMDIGEHPGCNRGYVYLFTNADSVRMYKNGEFVKEFCRADSPYPHLKHGPLVVDDFVGDVLETKEHMKPAVAKDVKALLNMVARHGLNRLPAAAKLKAAKLIAVNHMTFDDAARLYNLYVGDWGGASTSYRFDAMKNGKVVKSITREPMHETRLEVQVSHWTLTEGKTYDVAAVRIRMTDENGGLLSFWQEPLKLETSGPIELIGPAMISLQGGMGGTYVRTTGESGEASLTITGPNGEQKTVCFEINKKGDREA